MKIAAVAANALVLLGLNASNPLTRSAKPQPVQYDLQSALFPPSHTYSSGFTTASNVVVPGISKTALKDKALNATAIYSGHTHNVVTQAGKTAWQANYPKGSWNPSNTPHGGFGLYVGGTSAFQNQLQMGATEVLVSYSVMFQQGWLWNMGGKLPGAFGGIGANSKGCAGGRQTKRSTCFSMRLMWRDNGAGEVYTYLPLTTKNNVTEQTVPGTILDGNFGNSVGRGQFTFPAGQWVTVAERVKLNDPNVYNGEIQLWFNANPVVNLTGVLIRNSTNSVVQGIQFETFFGGSTNIWASPQNQSAWFADVSGAIITPAKKTSQFKKTSHGDRTRKRVLR